MPWFTSEPEEPEDLVSDVNHWHRPNISSSGSQRVVAATTRQRFQDPVLPAGIYLANFLLLEAICKNMVIGFGYCSIFVLVKKKEDSGREQSQKLIIQGHHRRSV